MFLRRFENILFVMNPNPPKGGQASSVNVRLG